MKRNSFIILTSLFLFISAGCEKTEQNYYHLGVNGYQKNGITYDHVFATVFPCKSSTSTFPGTPDEGAADKPFYVKIIDQPEPGDPNCGTCLAVVSNAPNKWLHISVSQQCNTN
jgi:hypothetical protein